MIKLGSIKLETVPISKCNLKGLPGKVAITSVNPEYCPICGKPLQPEFSYGVQVNKDECVKFRGSVCLSCNTFFSSAVNSFSYLEHKRVDKSAYRLIRDYNVTYSPARCKSLFDKQSAFRQYVLLSTQKVRVITVVSNLIEQSVDQDVWHFTSRTAVLLLSEEKNRFITIDGIKYCIERIRTREILDTKVQFDVDATTIEEKFRNDEFPDLTTEQTLYLYRGEIDCHTKHHVFEFKASIPSFDGNAVFFVEYCYECGKFLMKYSDYEVYIRRLKMFPLKVCMNDYPLDNRLFDLADESPLMLNGYSVRQDKGLNSNQRHAILSFIVNHGIINKRKTLDYLEYFIHTNQNHRGCEMAVSKWAEDKAFLLNYHENEVPLVNVGCVERR